MRTVFVGEPGLMWQIMSVGGQFPNAFDGFHFPDTGSIQAENLPGAPFVTIQAYSGNDPVGPSFDILLCPYIDPYIIQDLKPETCLMKLPSPLIVLLFASSSGSKDAWREFDYFGLFRNPLGYGAALCFRPVKDGKTVPVEDFPPLMITG